MIQIFLSLLFFALILSPPILFAGQGSAGAKFLQINSFPRAAGLGGTMVARGGLLEGVHYNPASIATLKGFTAIVSHSEYFVDMGYEQFSAAYRTSFGTIAVGMVGLFSGEMEETTELDPLGTGRMFTANDYALHMSFGKKFTDKFSGGWTAKYVIQTIDKLSATNVVFDIGALYNTGLINNLVIGFALRNFGKDMHYSGENLQKQVKLGESDFEEEDVRIEVVSEDYQLPISFELGFSMDFPLPLGAKLTTSLAIRNIVDQAEFSSAGVELNIKDFIILTAGHGNLNSLGYSDPTDAQLNGNMRGFSGGFGVNLEPVFRQKTKLFYGFEDHRYLEPIHSVGVQFQL
ncbi:MAG: PorV/PorQ family protein [Candidatus Marinimicrobia bacterium]|nr:PorV/PorQ family protein [Candidatus Neomarinimicrobiota bacterium]MBT3618783.1 PorV/PorQ family protein [Candidatus Neomarinimicrobiota bacterium]MBT3829470.1 PorV/PorQ family protein [Candidatus Neomarinimicrobiota bacterium]MBT3996676.1 PorV/PorQ family protein [Candidatus Neomarinimicrobiota bacterium]MBT4281074.1 PorV/PorQ family protein [Candidatus Neomarinimicrobiota bacterium]